MEKNYAIHTGEMLKALFPYMFNKPNIGFAFYRGWMPIMAGVCVELDQVLGGQRELFHWTQIKEKFGTYRLYYALANRSDLRIDIQSPQGVQSIRQQPAERSELQKSVGSLVDAAEQETAHACMICGEPAQTKSYSGYHMTLCDQHHPEKICGDGDHCRDAIWDLATPKRPEGGSS